MPAFASVDVPEKLLALVSRYALQSDAVWAMPVQVTILDAYPEAWRTILSAFDSSSGSLLLTRKA
jgi:hypothetical protein